jgi:hypothetical protein
MQPKAFSVHDERSRSWPLPIGLSLSRNVNGHSCYNIVNVSLIANPNGACTLAIQVLHEVLQKYKHDVGLRMFHPRATTTRR